MGTSGENDFPQCVVSGHCTEVVTKFNRSSSGYGSGLSVYFMLNLSDELLSHLY